MAPPSNVNGETDLSLDGSALECFYAVASLISIDEYLKTSYEPDCDYVDGAVEERNLGKFKHGRMQALLTAYLVIREKVLGICTITEQRVRLSGLRVRIPDICVLIDPNTERCYTATSAGLVEAHNNILRTDKPGIVVPVHELFDSLRR